MGCNAVRRNTIQHITISTTIKNLNKRRLFPNSMQCYKIKTVFLTSEILIRAKYFASEEKALNVSCDFGQNRDPLANSQFE